MGVLGGAADAEKRRRQQYAADLEDQMRAKKVWSVLRCMFMYLRCSNQSDGLTVCRRKPCHCRIVDSFPALFALLLI